MSAAVRVLTIGICDYAIKSLHILMLDKKKETISLKMISEGCDQSGEKCVNPYSLARFSYSGYFVSMSVCINIRHHNLSAFNVTDVSLCNVKLCYVFFVHCQN